MKRHFVLLCLLILVILINNFSRSYSQNILLPDSLASYNGKIIMKNSDVIKSDYIKILKDCIIYKNYRNYSIDTLKSSSVDFFRLNMGNYALEYAGLGVLGGTVIVLYAYSRLSLARNNSISTEACLGVIGGSAVIGLIIGLVTQKQETFYLSKNINISLIQKNNINGFYPNNNLFTININI